MASSFVQFGLIKDDAKRQQLKTQFLNDPTNKKLAHVLNTSKNKSAISMTINECKISGMYIVMVKGNNDGALIKLGVECGFPRGFPVLWVPNVSTRYFGFLPKFENDDRQQIDTFDDKIESIRFFKKWSGFLGQLLVWEFNGNNYWTVCSKNAVGFDSNFVRDAHRLFEPFVTDQLVEDMIKLNLHICAEMISKKDQVHGSKTKNETPVVTVVGKQITTENKQFVEFLSHPDVVKFCVLHNLPCDSAITIRGQQGCSQFLSELTQKRDFMDDSMLNKLVESQPQLLVEKGTITHYNVVGERLEGLVLNLTFCNGKSITKKYKFPGYTIRTMLFRPKFEGKKMFTFGAMLKKDTQRFVNFWCVSEAGKDFWYNKGLEGFICYENKFRHLNCKTFHNSTNIQATAETETETAIEIVGENDNTSEDVGVHIQLGKIYEFFLIV